MSNELNIISTEEVGNLCILPNRQYSSLIIKGEDGDWTEVKEGSCFRPIHLSELSRALQERGWNYGLLPFESLSGELMIGLDLPTQIIPDMRELSGKEKAKVSSSTEININNIKEDEEYAKILKEMEEKEINLYATSTSEIDLVSGTQTLDLVAYNSDTYTNAISLVPLKFNMLGEKVSAKVEMSISYTYSGVSYSYSTTFPAFSYISGKLEENLWIEEVGKEVQIEYVSGIIRVVPISSNVTECIISQCIIEYGRLSE